MTVPYITHTGEDNSGLHSSLAGTPASPGYRGMSKQGLLKQSGVKKPRPHTLHCRPTTRAQGETVDETHRVHPEER